MERCNERKCTENSETNEFEKGHRDFRAEKVTSTLVENIGHTRMLVSWGNGSTAPIRGANRSTVPSSIRHQTSSFFSSRTLAHTSIDEMNERNDFWSYRRSFIREPRVRGRVFIFRVVLGELFVRVGIFEGRIIKDKELCLFLSFFCNLVESMNWNSNRGVIDVF